MYKLLCLVALCVLWIVQIQAAQENVDSGDQGNGDLYIDEKGQRYDEREGSADDDDYSGANPPVIGDDEDGDGASGDSIRKLSQCEKQRESMRGKGADTPLCTKSGEYEAKQCSSNGDCWCVNFKGEEIPGTTGKEPWHEDCNALDRSRPYTTPTPGTHSPTTHNTEKSKEKPNLGNPPDSGEDILVEHEQPSKTDKTNVDIGPMSDEDTNPDEGNSDGTKQQLREGGLFRQPLMLAVEIVTIGTLSPDDRFEEASVDVYSASLFSKPGVLAGLIAVAVVCLLCAVLLVMFIVYRMRKKDEGSYALDEPKRSPSHPYQRAPTREFFA